MNTGQPVAIGSGTKAGVMARRSKYANETVDLGGVRFDSKREARRWGELQLMERVGRICDLRRQVRYRLEVNGLHVCDYLADFTYQEEGELVVEDVKSPPTRTAVYRVKKKLLKALMGLDIREV
jgi:hypothetical protein